MIVLKALWVLLTLPGQVVALLWRMGRPGSWRRHGSPYAILVNTALFYGLIWLLLQNPTWTF